MSDINLYKLAQQALATPAERSAAAAQLPAPETPLESAAHESVPETAGAVPEVSMVIPRNWALWLRNLKNFPGKKANDRMLFL